jgi:VIT1/CCC1 family predicted Fe2+/Mn2+ transporter
MALGEFVSVSTQRDTERALIAKERLELETMPEAEHAELVGLLRRRGLSEETSRTIADELSQRDPLHAHLDIELGIDEEELVNPWAAGGSRPSPSRRALLSRSSPSSCLRHRCASR